MRPVSSRSAAPTRLLFWVFLGAALALRAGIFALPHDEGDEKIYAALVEQVETGRGYTLAGHPILAESWMIRDQYDTPLFYHPPAGVLWMASFALAFGTRGLDIAQLAAFILFYAAMWSLARRVLPSFTLPVACLVAGLAGATPIVAHVSIHRWLDGPQVAAVALAACLAVRALSGGRTIHAAAAGIAMGVAMLVKLNAVLALPGIAALAWAASGERPAHERVRLAWIGLGVAAAVVAPWLAIELHFFGTIVPAWAGKPSARLVAENPFIRQITAVRTPFAYLRLLPLVVGSLVPSLAALAILKPGRRERAVAAACLLWIGTIVGAHMALGAIGYSKLLRYVVLASPAMILLAGLAAGLAIEALSRSPSGRPLARAILAVLVLGVAIEIAQGIQTVRVYPDRAWIRPLMGRAE